MGVVKKEFDDVVIDADADRLFKARMDAVVLFPKIFGDKIGKTSCYQGHHLVEGGVVEIVYPPGRALFSPEYTCGRDVYLNTLVDYDKRVNKYDFTVGELKDRCQFYKGATEFVPTESGTKSIVKHVVEFEPLDDTDTSFIACQERAALENLHRLEEHLKANPTEYTS